MAQEYVVIVEDGGEVRFVHEDGLAAHLHGQGAFDVRRASTVEPVDDAGGELLWEVNLAPVGGPRERFHFRQDAIDWEIAWLTRNDVPKPQ